MHELALAEWGLTLAELSSDELSRLTVAWMRRQRFFAQMVASEVGRLFAGEREQMTPEEAWAEMAGLAGG